MNYRPRYARALTSCHAIMGHLSHTYRNVLILNTLYFKMKIANSDKITISFIKIDGYLISRFIRNLIGRKRCHAIAMSWQRNVVCLYFSYKVISHFQTLYSKHSLSPRAFDLVYLKKYCRSKDEYIKIYLPSSSFIIHVHSITISFSVSMISP